MVTLAAIILSLDLGDRFVTLNLYDAYFHVAIGLPDQCFLKFVVCTENYQYCVLPFSLSVTLRGIKKVLSILTAHL